MAPQNTAVGILLVFFVIFVILFFIGMARVNSREPCGYAQTTDKKKENAEKAAIFLKRDKKDLGTFKTTFLTNVEKCQKLTKMTPKMT